MPSKTIEDFAYQIRDYMRSAEVVEGKNHAYSQENNAVIATIENGKSYKVRWTGSATVTLKKNSASGTEVTSGSTSPLSFTADSDFDLYFGSSADVTEIMVYDGNDTSDTYEPYYVPVKDSKLDIADQQVLGAWNELPNNGISATINGITWTKYPDGSVKANGMASNVSYFDLNIGGLVLPKGEHYLSAGSIDGNYSSIGGLYVISNGVDLMTTASESSSHCSLSEDTEITSCRVFIRSGVVVTNLMIYPMIAVKPNQPYVPPAMTNRELTEEKTGTCTATISSNNATLESAYYVIIGKVMWVYVSVKTTSAIANAGRIIITLTGLPSRNALSNSIFVPCFGKENLIAWFGASNPNSLSIQNNGTELASDKTLQLSGCIPV